MAEDLTIEDGVLIKCKKDVVGEVIIPEGVTQIGRDAYERCYNLDSATRARIKEIQNMASRMMTEPTTIITIYPYRR